MPLPFCTASAEPEPGVLTALAHWLQSLFAMLALSMAPKPLHYPSSDSSETSDHASLPPDSLGSFSSTPPSSLSSSSSSSSSSSLIQESPSSANMFAQPASPAASHHDGAPITTKRPKLSLQTSSLPMTFGKSTTALSLALSANCSPSPTVRNTFNNAYDGFRRTASSSPVGLTVSSPKGPSRAGKRGASYLCNYQTTSEAPYQLPLGLRSILRNSPLHTSSSSIRRPSLSVPSGNNSSNGHSGRKALFPAKRQVRYRFPLDEEIKTVRYVARHSDLSEDESPSGPSDVDMSSEEESDSSLSLSKSSPSDDDEPSSTLTNRTKNINSTAHDTPKNSNQPSNSEQTLNPSRQRPRAKRKHSAASERQIRAVALREDHLAPSGAYGWDNTPQTPLLHKRRKRPREWRWTLGPIENGLVQQQQQPHPINNDDNPATPAGTLLPTPVPVPAVRVPVLSPPLPKRRQGSLAGPKINMRQDLGQGQGQGRDKDKHKMGDVLHEASSIPLPESLRSSPGISPHTA
ncbi:hypothetical protein FQN50_009301 [Emmonsiellopsis sp. PD_5]|nr:hypothetical protein FQN50_009301 [Emmonsiellopsis sp. PD_5]